MKFFMVVGVRFQENKRIFFLISSFREELIDAMPYRRMYEGLRENNFYDDGCQNIGKSCLDCVISALNLNILFEVDLNTTHFPEAKRKEN